MLILISRKLAVCDTAKVRFFKQITTCLLAKVLVLVLFVILQKYDFSSKSQRYAHFNIEKVCCL